jgi:hypothetical protein
MSLITYEGFEKYRNLNSYSTFSGNSLAGLLYSLDSTDEVNVKPRNKGFCLKTRSNYNQSESAYPRILISSDNLNRNNGVFGFAFYNYIPSNSSVASQYSGFFPIAGLVSETGNPHFYIGINSLGQLQICRFVNNVNIAFNTSMNSNSSNVVWNTGNIRAFYGPITDTLIPFQTNSIYSLLGTTNNTLLINNWNYIECKYSISSSSATGLVQIKLNRAKTDSTLDINLNNVQLTEQSGMRSNIVLGLHRDPTQPVGFRISYGGGGNTSNRLYYAYYDDFYWCDLEGTSFNNFLGQVKCLKQSYDTLENYNFTQPLDQNQAIVLSRQLADTSALTTTISSTTSGQTIDLRSIESANETLNPIYVKQTVYGYKTTAAANITMGAQNGANNILNQNVSIGSNAATGHIASRDYDNAPDGTEWTNQKIAATTFRHTVQGS